MKKTHWIIFFNLLLVSGHLQAQKIKLNENNLVPTDVYMSIEKLNGKKVVKVFRDSTIQAANVPTFVRIKDLDFSNGSIEVKVLSRLLTNASPTARGFIGVAFRIDEQNSKFECIYLRPTNGRAEDQFRRNHAIQYFSYPDYKFDRLRKEAVDMYESYADMGLNEWITMRIEVNGQQAKLFLNNTKQPALIVNDLKLGADVSGAIGFWVDGETEGYFRDLKIVKQN